MSQALLTGLIAMQAIRNDGLAGADLPARLKLLNWGVNKTTKGPVSVGDRTAASLAAMQAQYGYDRVAIDYEHQSLPKHKNFKEAPREYAAYGVPSVIPGDGLYLESIQWTPSGVKNARNYMDLSPAPLLEEGEVVFLHSVALCPQGCVEDLSFYSAEFPPAQNDPSTKKPMNPDLLKLLTTLFGVAETATEEELLTAGRAFVEKQAKATDPAAAATALSADALTDLTKRLDDHERSRILADAARDGKIVPLSVQELPLESMRKVVSDLPKGVVPLGQETPEGVRAFSADNLTATDRSVCAQLGLTPEEFAKE